MRRKASHVRLLASFNLTTWVWIKSFLQVARLVFLPSAKIAMEFCQSCGLAVKVQQQPFSSSSSTNGDDDNNRAAKIVFKAGPIHAVSKIVPLPRSVEDEWIFFMDSNLTQRDACLEGMPDKKMVPAMTIIDMDGVVIPPWSLS